MTHHVTHREYFQFSKLGEHWDKQPRWLPAEPTGPWLRSILPSSLLGSSTFLGHISNLKKNKAQNRKKKKKKMSAIKTALQNVFRHMTYSSNALHLLHSMPHTLPFLLLLLQACDSLTLGTTLANALAWKALPLRKSQGLTPSPSSKLTFLVMLTNSYSSGHSWSSLP